MDTTDYFATARERYRIKLRRDAGKPRPWTEDPVFQQFRFCNVHREDDKTTEWFREHIRGPLTDAARDGKAASRLRLVEATLCFRWFNRIETGELIQDLLLNGWKTDEARRRLEDIKPLVTGAYMIKTEMGLSKLEGLLYAIDRALPKLPSLVPQWGPSIQEATKDLYSVHGLGPFLSYEITTDLRHTPILNEAADIMTWANAGPGCTHGLGRLFGDPWKWKRSKAHHQVEMVRVMQQLVEQSTRAVNWPTEWPQWEMRTAEHWACEYDKHCRGVDGDRLKRRYR